MQPFLEAIQYMFPNKKFKEIKQNDGFIIEFEEFGRKSTINDLSSGEKQIIFRGGFFLKNLSIIEGGIVLIDEPELSLHPEWQSRIVGFYHHLFSSLEACPQIIIVTHSPFVIHGALGAKTIVLQKNQENGQVAPMTEPTYPTIDGDAALFAFNIDDFLARHNEKPMVLLVEGQTDKVILTEAWSKLRPNSPMNFEIRNALGMKSIASTLNDASILFSIGDKKIVGLFDFDDAFNQWNRVFGKQPPSGEVCSGLMKKHESSSLYAMLLPVPEFRNDFASFELAGESLLCIEFLFPHDLMKDIIQETPLPCGQSKMTIKKGKKSSFAEKVKTFPKEAFSAFEPLFENLERILKNEL